MRASALLFSCLLAAFLATGAGVKVSEKFGYDPEDATRFLQAALDSGEKEIVVDAQKGPWYARPLQGRSNQTIVFEKGAFICAKRGEFHNPHIPLIRFSHCTNVTLRGEGPNLGGFRMWRDDYADRSKYKWSEWRHAVSLLSCVNVTLEGISANESGGDGLYISTAGGRNTPAGQAPVCVNTVVRNCAFERNYRQGISVIGADGLLIENVVMRDTKGTPPAAGIDFEPNKPWECLKNIVMRNCLSENNEGKGIEIMVAQYDYTSQPISMRFENCRCVGNLSALFFSHGARDVDYPGVDGTFIFENCTFEKSRKRAVSISRKPWSSGRFVFRHLMVDGCGVETPDLADFGLSVSGHPGCPVGEYVFEDVTVKQPQARPVISYAKRLGPYEGEPTRFSGAMKVVTSAGTHVESFDAAWRASNFVWRAGSALPLPPRVPGVPVDARIVDAKPGEMAPCAHAFVRGKGKFFVFHASAAGEVHLRMVQTCIGKRDYGAVKRPMRIYRLGDEQPVPGVAVAMPREPEGGVATFKVPGPGFYQLEILTGGNGVAVLAADVPVALDATRGLTSLVAPSRNGAASRRWRGEAAKLFFWVPAGRTFGCVAAGEDSESVGLTLANPIGEVVWREPAVSGVARTVQTATTAGLWSLSLAAPALGAYEDHAVSLNGVSGWYFLSAEKYWK